MTRGWPAVVTMLYQVSVDGVGVGDVFEVDGVCVGVCCAVDGVILIVLVLVSVVCTQMPWRDLSPNTAANTIKCVLVVAKTALSIEGKN